ncbi:T9SS type A sorting domain-containing protein [Salinibacter ruber]|uniref:Fibronectin type-III domain-containing protein n=1 Tax=Salinibacter ruber TaxID=146919 RepID=A0A9X2TIM5_9BACT|nr:T9SS C-terminal target domain-containing protein [Salinibacter ruber]MCS3659420.1 hypothetical protein [Salinibacter ruber]MCS3708988.1 hypothetical protein [Salinibacter ruber]MCS4121054.1 hypothetical protein [Salinibacter ruber]
MTSRLLLLLGLLLPLGAVAQEPQNLDAVPGNQENTLTWDAPTVDDKTVVCYGVYRDTESILNDNPEDQGEKRVDEVDAAGEESPSYTDTGLTNGETYYYRVTAETAETEDTPTTCGSSNTEESSFSNEPPPATPFAPVTLQIIEPTVPESEPVDARENVEVEVNATNVPSEEPVRLRYRQGGADMFSLAAMEEEGDTFTGAIPGEQATLRGIEFFVFTLNPAGDTVRAPSEGVTSIRVEADTESLSQPGGTAATAYRMVSFPGELDDPQLSNLFSSLGSYDPVEWRLFRADGAEGDYVEQSNLSKSLSPGEGLWFIRRSSGTLTSVEATSIRTDRPYEIQLDEGWNLIGNPFAFDVPLSQVRVENTAGSLQDVFGYNGNFVNQQGGVLEPYRGYLVYLSGGQNGTLVVHPSPEEAPATTSSARAPDARWAVDLSARVGQARDPMNTLGTAPNATDGVEAADGREPPPIGDYVSLSFRAPSQDRGLWRDMRSTGGGLRTWTAEVRTNVSGLVTVNASDISSVPDDQSVWLVDPVLDQTQNLRETPTYQFPASEATDARSLRILVGPSAAVQRRLGRDADRPERVELLPSVPHPVRSYATFRYRVPERTRATLELYDLLGRRVATLVDDESVGPGTHTYAWTRQNTGGTLSSGAYLLRLQAGDVTRTRRLVIMQ